MRGEVRRGAAIEGGHMLSPMSIFSLHLRQAWGTVFAGVYRISATRAFLALASAGSFEAFARPHATPWLPGKTKHPQICNTRSV
jgi:hypothetical protein